MTCLWCHENEADGGVDAIGGPWCKRCRDAETALQEAKKGEQK